METEKLNMGLGSFVGGLGRLTLATLLVTALVYLSVMLGSGAVELFGPHVGIAIALAVIVGVGFRWAPALAGFVMALLIVETLVFAGHLLTTPGDLKSFAEVAILIPTLAVGLCAGIGATAQNYRRPLTDRRAPTWLRTGLVAGAALVAGAILAAAIQQPRVAAGITPEALAVLPAVMAKDFKFDQPEIQAKVGETVALRLDNLDTTTHYFEIEELNVHAVMQPGKSGLALFRPTRAGTYTIYCAPHSDRHAGTGMVGKLIVTP